MNVAENIFIEKKSSVALTGLFVFAVVFAVFSGAMQNDFIALDDPDFIKNNPMIQALAPRNVAQMATSLYQGVWHPLTWLSHAIDYRLFRLNPAGHHFTNILLHSFNAVWVFVLFMRLAGKNDSASQTAPALLAGGAMAAVLFGIHPLRVESVVWVSNRKDLLCSFFILATYWAYLSYVFASNKKSRGLWYVAAIALMSLALMSKSIAVTIPLVLLILDVYPLKRWQDSIQRRQLIAEKIPFFALSLLIGTVTLVSLRNSGLMVSTASLSMPDRVFNAFKSCMFYLSKTLWPVDLVPIYPLIKKADLPVAELIFPVVGVVVLTLACFRLWRRQRPLYLVAWVYYLFTVAPVLGITQAGRQAAADRYTYLSTLSLYILIGLGLARLWEWNSGFIRTPMRKTALALFSVFIMTGLGYLTVQQTTLWRNSEVFWGYIARSIPGGLAIADYNLGQIYEEQGRIKQAEAQYKKALLRDPKYVDAHNGLGLLFYGQVQYAEAEAEYKQALALKPDAIVHNNLGLLYYKQGRNENARAEFLAALAMSPNHLEAHNNLGLLYSAMGLLQDAEKEYKAALSVDFDYALAHLNLGVLYKKTGALPQAEQEFKLGIYLEPERAETHTLLGEVYLMRNMKTEAVAAFKEARRLCLEKPKALRTSNCSRQP